MPSINPAVLYLPNFFTKGKGPNRNTAVYKRQALYDGAVGARGVHKLRSYVNSEMADNNNIYTIISTYYYSSLLTVYTFHPTTSKNTTNPTKYYITQLRSFAITDHPDTF